jgi:hypothetical protein
MNSRDIKKFITQKQIRTLLVIDSEFDWVLELVPVPVFPEPATTFFNMVYRYQKMALLVIAKQPTEAQVESL